MNVHTIFNKISDDWTRVKNHCRTTVNKEFTDKEPTIDFKKKLLISEHSPIRLLEFDWSWRKIYYWVSTEWSRHKFEKFITSQRDDRTTDKTPRGEKRQDSLVDFDGCANMQNLIDVWRKRLCHKATKEARELAENFKCELAKTHPIEASVLVPNCIYRYGCPEMSTCGHFHDFLNWCHKNNRLKSLCNIQKRYDNYNEFFKRSQDIKNSKNKEMQHICYCEMVGDLLKSKLTSVGSFSYTDISPDGKIYTAKIVPLSDDVKFD